MPTDGELTEKSILAYHDRWKAELYEQASKVEAEGRRPDYNSPQWWAWLTRQKLENLDTMLLPRTSSVLPKQVSSSEDENDDARSAIDERVNSDASTPRPASECDTDGDCNDGDLEEYVQGGLSLDRKASLSFRIDILLRHVMAGLMLNLLQMALL